VKEKIYQVIQEFDPTKDYGISIRPKEAQCLSLLRKGQSVIQKQFVEDNQNKFKSFRIYPHLVCCSFGTGEKIGILKYTSEKQISNYFLIKLFFGKAKK